MAKKTAPKKTVAKKTTQKPRTTTGTKPSGTKPSTTKLATAPVSTTPKKPLSTVAIVWIGLFVVLCLGVILALKFLVMAPADYTYNGYPFFKADCPGTEGVDCYFAELSIGGEPYTIQFYHHPTEVEDILFEYTALEALRETRTQPGANVIVGVPEGAPGQIGIAGAQLGRVLGQRYGILNFDVTAMVIGSGPDRVDCDDARTNTVIIAFHQAEVDGVFVPSPNCIVLAATSSDQAIAVADAFVYRIFGIIRTVRDVAPEPTS